MILDKKRNIDKLYERKVNKKHLRSIRKPIERKATRDTENYIPYHSSDKNTEDGLAINSFDRQAQQAEISISQATQEPQYKPGQKKWDRIKKKMVSVQNPKNGKIRTESGIWIPATYKTGRYADWKEKTKTEDMVHQEMGLEGNKACFSSLTLRCQLFSVIAVHCIIKHIILIFLFSSNEIAPKRDDETPTTHWKRHNIKMDLKKRMQNTDAGAIKAPDQIVRERLRLELIKNRERINKRTKDGNRKRHAKNVKRKQK